MEQLTYKLDCFEGPMDLLLSLVRGHKMDIMDVPILTLVEQYLAYIARVQEENLELASAFLEMAARLLYIKTVSLLPVHEEMEELTRELRGELLEYQDCKRIAQRLSEMAQGFGYYSREPQTVPADMAYRRLHEPDELSAWYLSAVGKKKRRLPPPVEAFSGIIAHRIVSVAARIRYVLSALRGAGKQPFLALFRKSASRSELVATFLALLSLAKEKSVKVAGEGRDMQVILVEDREVSDAFGE